ncbi:TniQ family protein, partial [Paenibacillus sp. TAF58]
MMNFLPLVYKDELLYSVISRYKQKCGMISKAALSKDLFNGKTLFKSILFPQYLKFFMSNLPYNSKLSMEELILKHTLFPFYTAFLAEDNAENIYNGMVEGIGTSFENQIGLAGSKVNLNNFLKFCPLCYRDDEKLGESYWRRSHQIVGALYCLQHEVTLANSNVASSHNLINYSCADVDVCNQKVLN